MAAEPLSQELITAGEELLRWTDGCGLEAQGAAWFYDYGLEEWQYFIITELVDTMGRRKVYDLLIQAFEKRETPEGLTIVDVHLTSPRHPIFSELGKFVEVKDSGLAIFQNCSLNDIRFDAVMYRWQIDKKTQKGKKFRRRVKELVTA